MRTLLNVMASGALSAVLVVSSTLLASPAAGQADPPPWVIATASREPGSTCRATSSRPTPRARAAPTAGPARTTGRTMPSTACASA